MADFFWRGALCACLLLAAACTPFVLPEAGGLPDPEAVTLRGAFRYYLFATSEIYIQKVDGQEPRNLLGRSYSARFAHGPHFVEIVDQLIFGYGVAREVCAFEIQTEAGQEYRLKLHSLVKGTRRGVYPATITAEISGADQPPRLVRLPLECLSFNGSFCRDDADCEQTPLLYCESPEEGDVFGVCRRKREAFP